MHQLTIFTIAILCSLLFTNCSAQKEEHLPAKHDHLAATLSPQDSLFQQYSRNSTASVSKGTPASGSLTNGYPVPYSGRNFFYFDSVSYMNKRGFLHKNVLATLLNTYTVLEESAPDKQFGIMECSLEHGGKIEPHRTHQNGMSVDFMSPLKKDGKPCTEYDHIGPMHYLMDFDDEGRYLKDPLVSIDFELMAQHLLTLNEEARKNNLKIEKIIWKTELQDELFAMPSGKKLKCLGIYVTKKLSPLINKLHDDHYHVDFIELK